MNHIVLISHQIKKQDGSSIMNSRENEVLSARVIPPVHCLEVTSDSLFFLTDGCLIKLCVAEEELYAAGIASEFTKNVWNISPEFDTKIDSSLHSIGPDEYEITVTPGELLIQSRNSVGVRNAMKTLRQLAEAERGVLTHSQYVLPTLHIKDQPATAFRAMHLCWIPETPEWEIEKQIRLAAYYKFNYIVLESWGVLRFQCHPEMVWSEYAVSPDELRRLVSLGRQLGVILIPQLNLFGHASFSRCGTGKHVLLDFHPEFQSLFEPDGWTWCLSNPETRSYLTDLVLELHDIFDCPPFFHIGCDEAYNAGSCLSCRRSDYPALLKEHLLYFHDLFAKRNTRVMMWHDMLLTSDDERWKGYIVCGHKEDHLDSLYQELPKDMIICDWQYGYPQTDGKAPDWPTARFFQKNGFSVVVCPWLDPRGTWSLGELAATEHLFGIMETTWHLNHSHNMFTIFYSASKAAWAPFKQEVPGVVYREFFNRHLREVGWDMKLSKYIETGSVQHQINPQDHQN